MSNNAVDDFYRDLLQCFFGFAFAANKFNHGFNLSNFGVLNTTQANKRKHKGK